MKDDIQLSLQNDVLGTIDLKQIFLFFFHSFFIIYILLHKGQLKLIHKSLQLFFNVSHFILESSFMTRLM